MVKDKLRKALEDAVSYYNGGMSADESIVKSASDHDLTVDQTDRVVESFNTAKTINYFDKNASDRTGNFDLASKKNVTLALFGKDVSEKRASAPAIRETGLSSFYLGAPDRSMNRKNLFAEKRAAFLDALATTVEEKWRHGYSDRTLQDMASDAYATIKSAEADIDSAIGTINSYLCSAIEKIASDLTKGAYDIPEDRANLFKVACPHDMVIKEVSNICPLLKSASGGKYARMNVVDTSSVDTILKEADDIMDAVRQRSSYRQKKAEFRKKAELVRNTMMKDPGMPVKTASGPEDMLHRPTVKKAQFMDLFSGNDVKGLSDALVKSKSRKEENERLRDETRGAILADLLSSDPILQDADPRQVSAIYKSIVSASPRVSLNKEVVRSVLRGAVNSIAISPNDMKVLTDVDEGINTAMGTPRMKSERKDAE